MFGRSRAHLLSAACLIVEIACAPIVAPLVAKDGLTVQPCFDDAPAKVRAKIGRELVAEMKVGGRHGPRGLGIEDNEVCIRAGSELAFAPSQTRETRGRRGHPVANSLKLYATLLHGCPHRGQRQAQA